MANEGWIRAEDVNWVQVCATERGKEFVPSSPVPVIVPVVPTILLTLFSPEHVAAALAAASDATESLESIAAQLASHVKQQTVISRDLLELGAMLFRADAKVGLERFVAPLVVAQSLLPCQAFCERLVLQLKLDDRAIHSLALAVLSQPNNECFTELELGFWQRCILNKPLHSSALLDKFLLKLDVSAPGSKSLPGVVFTLIKSNKLGMQPHKAILESMLNRSPTDAALLFPAKRALNQL
ncbi:hypothetical protein BASA81_001435 [Batrachochytrium salamandrivorans]|nr:hypothetical protein BASA81_001435 [Batrachochytrium salamandrivorans]